MDGVAMILVVLLLCVLILGNPVNPWYWIMFVAFFCILTILAALNLKMRE